MSSVISCHCGAKVRLPAATGSRSFRCPKCKAGIALTTDVRVLSSRRFEADDPEATCPICQCAIAAAEHAVTCPQCDQVHHRECWAEIGGCGTYGCEQAPRLDKSDSPAREPLSAWGDEKTCPACGEAIKAIALKCRYCGEEFDTVDPLSLGDLKQKIHRDEQGASLKKTVVVLFVLSVLLACLAPILAIVNAAVIVPKRHDLARLGPVFQILGYSAVGLTVLYSILMIMFVAWEL